MSVYQSAMGRVSLLYPCGGCEDKHVIGDAQKHRAGEGCMIERLLCTSKRLSLCVCIISLKLCSQDPASENHFL